MGLILKHKITGPAAWHGCDLKDNDSWVHPLSQQVIAALERALGQVLAKGLSFSEMRASDFVIPELDEHVRRWAHELEDGRGFLILRGLPVERYTDREINIIYYGIGLNLGIPVRQNPAGDLIGTVMNVGDPLDERTRVYETNRYLPYHTDPTDVVGLLCLRRAKSGGTSSLVSVAAIYNEILQRYPEFLGIFYRPTWFAHLGQNEPARSPIFSYHDDKLSCRYLRQYIELGHSLMNIELSRIEIEALDLFDEVSHYERLRLDMMLEPGDLQWANNYAVLHSRTAFEDWEDQNLRRKKLRLWLKMPNARRFAADFPGRNGFGPPGKPIEWTFQ